MKNMYKICSSCGKRISYSEVCECRKERAKVYQNKNSDGFYNTTKWKKLRKSILERDNHICQRCLHKFEYIETEYLQVHHIQSRRDYPELSYEPSNLICVCRTCNLQLGNLNKLDFEWQPNHDECDDFVL